MPAVTWSRNRAWGPLLRKLQEAGKLWRQLAGRGVIKNEDAASACCHLERFPFLVSHLIMRQPCWKRHYEEIKNQI